MSESLEIVNKLEKEAEEEMAKVDYTGSSSRVKQDYLRKHLKLKAIKELKARIINVLKEAK